jgi:photosystem II stability/assembly factor-like uncharacterized protein
MKKLPLFLTCAGLLVLALSTAAGAGPPRLTSLATTVAGTNVTAVRPVWDARADAIAPIVSAVAPASAPNDIDRPVTITGSGFTALMDGTGTVVLTSPTASLGGTALADVTWVDSSTLTATVPWGVDPGMYALTVVNPDGGAGGLSSAFTVTKGLGGWNGGELSGGDVRQIMMKPGDPDTLYAVAYGVVGLFRSTDAGEHWVYASNAVGVNNGKFAIDPQGWLYGYDPGGLYRSKDEGDTWTKIMPNIWPDGRDPYFSQVYVSPHDPQTLFISSADEPDYPYPPGAAGLIRSTDGGATWKIITELEGVSVQDVSFHPTDPLKMVLASAAGQVFRSTDGGGTWSEVTKPPLSSIGLFGVITYNPYKPTEVWLACTDTPQTNASGDIYKSTDAAFTSWQQVTPADGSGAQTVTFAGADSVYIGGRHSTDGGLTWQPFGPLTGGGQFAVVPGDPQTGYVCDSVFAVQKTTDGGLTWQVKDQGLTGMVCRSMDVSRVDPLRIYTPLVGWEGYYRSSDGAGSWSFAPMVGAAWVRQVVEDPFDAQRLYALAHDLYVSTDGGGSWPDVGWNLTPMPPDGSPHTIVPDPFTAGHLLLGWNSGAWAAGTGQLYSSSDHGASWQGVALPNAVTSINSIAFDPETPGLAWLTTNATGVYRSTDGGASWERVDDRQRPVMEHAASISIATHPRHVVLIGTAQPSFRSLDGGTTWERLQSSPSGGSDFMFAGADSTRLYGATGTGLFLSIDRGDTWNRAAGTLGHVQVTAMGFATATDHTIIYAATTGGSTGTASGTVAAAHRSAAAAGGGLIGAGVYRYVLVPTPKVTFKLSGLSSGSLRLGRRVTAKGVVTLDRLVGSKVKLNVQKKRSGRWVTLKPLARKIGVHGTYTGLYRPATRGVYRMRAEIARTATNTAAATSWRSFKVK